MRRVDAFYESFYIFSTPIGMRVAFSRFEDPWTFFNYLNPLLSIGLAYLGFGIFKKIVNGEPALNS